MEYDDTFAGAPAPGIDLDRWEPRHRDYWRERLGRRYLLSVVPTHARTGRILEIGAAWFNKYQKEIVGLANELTILDVKDPDSPDLRAIAGLDRYVKFDMTQRAGAPADLLGAFDEIRSWGVLSHVAFTPEQCRTYVDNVHAFLKPGGQVIFKLDVDTDKKRKHLPGVGPEFLEALIRTRFTLLHTDTLRGNTPGRVLYGEAIVPAEGGGGA